jgi:hypothetical protein
MHNELLSMRISPLQNKGLAERLRNLSGIMCAIDFATSREPGNVMEPMWVPHDCKHAFFALDVGPGFSCHLGVGQSPRSARGKEKEKPELITRHQTSPIVFSRRF